MSIKIKSWSSTCGHCKIGLTLNGETIEREFDWSFGQFKERLASNILGALGVGLAWIGYQFQTATGSESFEEPFVVGRGPDTLSVESVDGYTVKHVIEACSHPDCPVYIRAGNRKFDLSVDQTVVNSVSATALVQEDDNLNQNQNPTSVGGVRYEF